MIRMNLIQRVVLLLLLALSSVPLFVHADDQEITHAARTLLGAWKDQDDMQSLIRFEPARCTFTSAGPLGKKMGRVAYEPGKVTVCTWGHKTSYQYEVKGGTLRLTMPDGKQ